MRPARLDVLLALLGSTADRPATGDEVASRLRAAGRPVGAGRLLTMLLALEETGHVHVDRASGYSFRLSEIGEAAAYDLGPGREVDLIVVMVDLVGFVTFTEAHGDDAGLRAALELGAIVDDELTRQSGRVVKHLGDGVMGTLPAGVDPIGPLRAIAGRCERSDGSGWRIRAAARHGRVIAHGGDVYGRDVNLTARMCGAARPGQAVLSGFVGTDLEPLDVRGLSEPVPVHRVPIG